MIFCEARFLEAFQSLSCHLNHLTLEDVFGKFQTQWVTKELLRRFQYGC